MGRYTPPKTICRRVWFVPYNLFAINSFFHKPLVPFVWILHIQFINNSLLTSLYQPANQPTDRPDIRSCSSPQQVLYKVVKYRDEVHVHDIFFPITPDGSHWLNCFRYESSTSIHPLLSFGRCLRWHHSISRRGLTAMSSPSL